jgi:hypothetical protein
MALITTIEAIRKNVSQLSKGVSFSDIEGDVRTAQREFIEPYFGSSFPDEASSDIKELLEESISNFAVYRFSMKNAVQLTASGMQTVSNDNFQSAAKWDKYNFRDILLSTGYSALEAALHWSISDNNFKQTPQYKAATARLLNFTVEIESYKLDFVTFQPLKKHIALVERQMLKPLLGALYNELLEKQYKNANEGGLNVLKTELLGLVRDALGQYAIELAFEQNLVNIVGQQVSIKTLKDEDASHQSVVPPLDLYTLAMKTKADYSARYFYALNDFLTQNASALQWIAPASTVIVANTEEQIGVKTLGRI